MPMPLVGDEEVTMGAGSSMLPPTLEDMKEMAFILANITDHLDTQPEVALSVASQHMGWLFSRNVPKLTQMLLQEYPSVRQDNGMMRAYLFLVDFLEAVGKETQVMLKKNQNTLRLLLEAAKVSEAEVDKVLREGSSSLQSSEFLLYLDSEIETQVSDSPMENLLVTIKLRVLDEIGKNLGVDVTILPKLAAEEDPAMLRKKTIDHLKSYECAGGKELFLQALRMMTSEMKKRYKDVDPILFQNLKEVEKICLSLIELDRKTEEMVR